MSDLEIAIWAVHQHVFFDNIASVLNRPGIGHYRFDGLLWKTVLQIDG